MKHRNLLNPVMVLYAVVVPSVVQPLSAAVARESIIAHIDLSTPVTEVPQDMPPLFASEMPISFKDLLVRLRDAREDRNVVAVILNVENSAIGLAQMEEVRKSVEKIKAAGKPVYVHADSLGTGEYALASCASDISITPTGDVWLTGIYGEAPYLRGMLDKMGVVPDFLQCGDFKSAGEMFMRTGPSEAAEKMENWLFDSIFESLVGMIAQGRGITPEKVKAQIDAGPYSADDALKSGIIDAVEHRQDFIARLRSKYGPNVVFRKNYGEKDMLGELPGDPFTLVSKIFQMMLKEPEKTTKPILAIVYVEGAIQTGEEEFGLFGGSGGAYSTTIRKALDKVAANDAVKGVVLRVDSPGGSALASEIILDAVKRVQAKGKPVVVSMGNVAGSGGYYVACSGDAIFADATTITASIGVIGGKLVTTGGWNKLGIHWHGYQRGRMAGMMSSASIWSDEERARMTKYMHDIYDVFKGHVTKYRGSKLTQPIDELAGGRVFTGEQALKLGLVDQIGGLSDAVAFAAKTARLEDYDLRTYPEAPNMFKMLFGGGEDEEYARSRTAGSLFDADSPLLREVQALARSLDPVRAAALYRAVQKLRLIQTEGVVAMMAEEWVIR